MVKCNWCKGRGWIQVCRKGVLDCPNCKGTGVGRDGGGTVGGAKRSYMRGNQYAKKRNE
jgi:hypothetical protein